MKGRIEKFLITALLSVVLSVLLTSCESESTASVAGRLYEAGRLDEAQECFLLALKEPQNADSLNLRLGYGYNMLELGEIAEAAGIFNRLKDECRELRNAEEASIYKLSLKALYEIYYESDFDSKLLETISLLEEIEENYDVLAEYEYERACLTEKRYYNDDEHFSEWVDAARCIIGHDIYVPDLHAKLYISYKRMNKKAEQLGIADEMYIYMKGHSAYIQNYDIIAAVMLDAARVAEYAPLEHDSEFYYSAAQEFIDLGEIKFHDDSKYLKYKIIVAEQKGNFELAKRLVGVYLNHEPDDKMAQKELQILTERTEAE